MPNRVVAADLPRRALPRRFFARDTETVARELLGCTLWTAVAGHESAGRVVEVEAYLDQRDPASHARGGPTSRSAIMFGAPGTAYVYLIYGMHHCLNVVTEPPGRAGAVLIRALEPLVGMADMHRRYRVADAVTLCAGPGRLCRALGIDLAWNGLPLGGRSRNGPNNPSFPRVWVAGGRPPSRISCGPRIGIRRAVDRPLRFCDPESRCLSHPPAGGSL